MGELANMPIRLLAYWLIGVLAHWLIEQKFLSMFSPLLEFELSTRLLSPHVLRSLSAFRSSLQS